MATPRFIPERWSTELLDQLRQNISHPYGLAEDDTNKKRIATRLPRRKKWLKARTKFLTQWEHLTEQGLEREYLEHDACYECSGELIPTVDTEQSKYVDNPDFDPALAAQRLAEAPTSVRIGRVNPFSKPTLTATDKGNIMADAIQHAFTDPNNGEHTCHCGAPEHWHKGLTPLTPNGWTRHLCEHCDSIRCDAYPGECNR